MKTRTTAKPPRRLVVQQCCWILPLVLMAAGSTLRADEPEYHLKIVSDRLEAVYDTGQEAQFLIRVTQGQQPAADGLVSFVVDDFITEYPPVNDYPSGDLKLDENGTCVVAVSSEQPVFLRCRVTYQPPQGVRLATVAAVGFSPDQIAPSLPVPEDFDQFWNDQKSQLAEVPLEPELSPVEQRNTDIECFDVQVPCLGGAPVSGYLGLPKAAQPKSLPAILWVHGAGVRSSSLPNAVKGAQAGMLSMDINAHGIPNGKPNEFYRDLTAGRLKNYRHEGRERRETVYFRGMFLRLVRAVDFLTSRPEWDGRVVAVIGHSQGGGQALVAGGIDDRVTMIATGVPAICDHTGRAAGRINGWPKLVPTGEDGVPDPAILDASRYVDAACFASRCRADAIMSVGFIDPVCPPSSCFAAYNALLGSKQIINEPLMSHAAPQHIQDAFFKCVQEHIAKEGK